MKYELTPPCPKTKSPSTQKVDLCVSRYLFIPDKGPTFQEKFVNIIGLNPAPPVKMPGTKLAFGLDYVLIAAPHRTY